MKHYKARLREVTMLIEDAKNSLKGRENKQIRTILSNFETDLDRFKVIIRDYLKRKHQVLKIIKAENKSEHPSETKINLYQVVLKGYDDAISLFKDSIVELCDSFIVNLHEQEQKR